MGLEKQLAELQGMISKFMEVHNNPHDTSKHNEMAGKLEALETYLSSVKTTNFQGLELENNECEEKFAEFSTFHSNGEGLSIFPDFPSINTVATDKQIVTEPPQEIDYFKLYKIIKTSDKFDGTCWAEWSYTQQYQWNYVVKRKSDFLRNQLTILLQKSYPNSDDAKIIQEMLQYYNAINEQYKSFPIDIHNIQNNKDFEKIIMLCDTEVLDKIAKSVSGKEAYIHALLTFKDYQVKRKEIPVDVIQPYQEAYSTLSFLYRNKIIIETLKSKKPASEEISIKTNELFKIVKKIKALNLQILDYETFDEYANAKVKAQEALTEWKNLSTAYTKLEFAKINESEVKDTRFEDFFNEVNIFYANANNTIKELDENIKTNYNNLTVIEDYRKHNIQTWARFKSSYLIGNPSKENQTDIDKLIDKLKKVITTVQTVPNLQNISSLKGIDLAEELKKWEERKKEVDKLLLQVEIWKKNIKKVDGLDGFTLEPQTFVEPNPKTVKTKKVNIAVEAKDDNGNKTAPNDVDQGNLGDCYFLASVASMATDVDFFYGKDDSVIQIVHPNKKGKKASELDPGKIKYFAVKMYLPVESSAMDINTNRTPVNVLVYPSKGLVGKTPLEYAQKADSGELWVAILERAFAEIRGGYSDIEGGFPEEGFALLMNKSAKDFNRINFDDKTMIDALKKELGNEQISTVDAISQKLQSSTHSKITLSTPSAAKLISVGAKPSPNKSINGDQSVHVFFNKTSTQPDLILYGNHAYSLQGINGDKFTIRNPHGGNDSDFAKKTEFSLTAAQIIQYFDSAVIL